MSNFNDLKEGLKQALTESKNDVDGAIVDPDVDILLDKMSVKMARVIDQYIVDKLNSLKTTLRDPNAFSTSQGPVVAGSAIVSYNPRE